MKMKKLINDPRYADDLLKQLPLICNSLRENVLYSFVVVTPAK